MTITQQVPIECEFDLSARTERSDYGVDNSPTWDEIVDEMVDGVSLGGVYYSYEEMVTQFGQKGADALCRIALEHALEDDWG